MKKYILFLVLTFLSLQGFGQEHPRVVCIHGFMVTARSMRMVSRILDCGGAETYVWSYPSRKRTIQEHACHLAYYLQEIAAECPGEPINFVAHSTGGVILRAALNLPECPEEARIGRAVLLAPPNKGAILARRFRDFYPIRLALGTKSGRNLMCWCESDIKALGEYPETMDIMVIAGYRGSTLLFNQPNDGFVTLRETMLDIPHRRIELNISHDQMVTSRSVLSIVENFIFCGCADEVLEIDIESEEE